MSENVPRTSDSPSGPQWSWKEHDAVNANRSVGRSIIQRALKACALFDQAADLFPMWGFTVSLHCPLIYKPERGVKNEMKFR